MALKRMCGVVLWSNPDDRKAVVWCEDQGNLAYYVEADDPELVGVSLDAGDLIEFELKEDRQMRRVTNPTLLVQDHAPDLAQQLGRCANTQNSADVQGHSNVVAFQPRRKEVEHVLATHVTA